MGNGLASPSPAEIKKLVQVAMGNEKADLVLIDGDLVNVYTGELLKQQSIAIAEKRIAFVGDDASHTIGPETKIIDASDKVIIPGFIDGHTHILWFYCLEEFLKYAMVSGTTTVITETIDLSFTLGYEGILQFLESAEDQPIKVFATAASTFANGQDGYADIITPAMFRDLLGRVQIMGLGETNWLPVIKGDDRVLSLFADTLYHGKNLEGHSAGARGNRLAAYVAAGISSCHEAITAEDALERLRLGLHVMIREGDVRKDLEAVARIKDMNVNSRRLILTTDGVGARHLMEKGYLNCVVQKAIDLGFDPITAIQMATLNVAEHYSISNALGGIAPGKYADIVIIPSLSRIAPECVISSGQIIFRNGRSLVKPRSYTYPQASRNTVCLSRELTAHDFAMRVGDGAREITARVIDLGSNIMNTEALITMSVVDGEIMSDVTSDILKVSAIDRTDGSDKLFVGLVRGFKLKEGAFAATANWDVSNVLVVGASDEDMAGAVNRVRELQGGAVVYASGQVRAELPLPIAGYVSDLPMRDVAERFESIQQELAYLGCQFPDAHLMLTTLTTPILPTLRISVDGLIGVKEGKVIDLVVMSPPDRSGQLLQFRLDEPVM